MQFSLYTVHSPSGHSYGSHATPPLPPQAAHVGLGIVGKEGKHASLAADFSLTQFAHCRSLILWHGRNAYLRSATLSQFIFHRGLIISFIQAVFSAMFYFASVPIYTGWLMVVPVRSPVQHLLCHQQRAAGKLQAWG